MRRRLMRPHFAIKQQLCAACGGAHQFGRRVDSRSTAAVTRQNAVCSPFARRWRRQGQILCPNSLAKQSPPSSLHVADEAKKRRCCELLGGRAIARAAKRSRRYAAFAASRLRTKKNEALQLVKREPKRRRSTRLAAIKNDRLLLIIE